MTVCCEMEMSGGGTMSMMLMRMHHPPLEPHQSFAEYMVLVPYYSYEPEHFKLHRGLIEKVWKDSTNH
jgi:hypothetical protein